MKIRKLLILRWAKNAKNAVFAGPIHVKFTLHYKDMSPSTGQPEFADAHGSEATVSREVTGMSRFKWLEVGALFGQERTQFRNRDRLTYEYLDLAIELLQDYRNCLLL